MNNMSILKEKLAYLRDNEDFSSADNPHTYFSSRYRYQLGPCLEESNIRSIEKQYRLTIPDDYRRFLIEVGNGGAGPAWGLYSIEEGFKKLEFELKNIPNFFERPFPHTTTWEEPDEACGEDNLDQATGSLPICNFGCAIDFILVLIGPEQGNIWMDDRATCNGIAPLTKVDGKIYWPYYETAPSSGTHVDFYTWYNTWLDKEISGLNSRLGR